MYRLDTRVLQRVVLILELSEPRLELAVLLPHLRVYSLYFRDDGSGSKVRGKAP